jgi:hypothetical protein
VGAVKILIGRTFLAEEDEGGWAQCMHDLLDDWQKATTREARKNVAHKITTLYGGMGSFGDLCLKSSSPLEKERSLQDAKHRLFDLAFGFR